MIDKDISGGDAISALADRIDGIEIKLRLACSKLERIDEDASAALLALGATIYDADYSEADKRRILDAYGLVPTIERMPTLTVQRMMALHQRLAETGKSLTTRDVAAMLGVDRKTARRIMSQLCDEYPDTVVIDRDGRGKTCKMRIYIIRHR